jgi:glycosyltransferase involved in cell wall biosynthesis
VLGGAAKAAYKLHKGLQKAKVSSTMLVLQKTIKDSTVKSFYDGRKNKILPALRSMRDLWILKLYPKREKAVWANLFFKIGLHKKIRPITPDVVHLQWISGGFASLKELSKIRQPIVWRLSDSYAFTGGCHLPFECTRYTQQCGLCPILHSKRKKDLSYYNWRRKRQYLSKANITFVCPSRWLAGCIKRSSLFGNHEVKVIPTGVDTTLYKPIQKQLARELLNLPQDKKIVLIGACAFDDKCKGGEHLPSIFRALSSGGGEHNGYEVVCFGSQSKEIQANSHITIRYAGYLNDDISLVLYYNACDVFLVPSTFDNLPNTAIESIACGTPVVAFDVCGLPDVVLHKVNGYLAKPFDVQDFVNGIDFVLQESGRSDALSVNARRIALEKFDIQHVTRQYMALYESLIH